MGHAAGGAAAAIVRAATGQGNDREPVPRAVAAVVLMRVRETTHQGGVGGEAATGVVSVRRVHGRSFLVRGKHHGVGSRRSGHRPSLLG